MLKLNLKRESGIKQNTFQVFERLHETDMKII